jgi:two-component system chemotaxis sensor kinase CheA
VKHLKRIVHTLKGNAAMFGLNSIASQCHQLETSLEEEQTRPTALQRAELTQRFERLRTNVDILLGDAMRTRIEVDPSEYEAVVYGLAHDEPRAKLAQRMTAWKLEPTSRRLERIAEQAQRIASRLNKGPLNIVLTDNDIGLEPAVWAPFWSSFVHVVRNAVDHGIEAKDERLATHKQEQGSLALTTRLEHGGLVIEIMDDGHGINWSAVADRARKAGIPHESSKDLMEAIFTDGISTATRVSELSGRGIGMGAVRAECTARGGTVEVSSSANAGTRVVFRFPEGAMIATALNTAA